MKQAAAPASFFLAEAVERSSYAALDSPLEGAGKLMLARGGGSAETCVALAVARCVYVFHRLPAQFLQVVAVQLPAWPRMGTAANAGRTADLGRVPWR